MTPERLLAGKHVRMSLAENKTALLWKSFLPLKDKIQDRTGTERFSAARYSKDYFNAFDPHAEFDKWACVEVSSFDKLADELETFIIPKGLYAVFFYKGLPSEGAAFFRYIFSEWLPSSGFEIDERPHFEILGAKYKNDSPDSEEEVWIPIKTKNKC
jgi:AraC family transcriptional regulator